MSEQENIKVIEQVYQKFKSGDIHALLGLMSEEMSWELPEIENVPFSGKRRGREEVGQFFKLLAEDQDVLSFEPREFVAQGDKVIGLGSYRWRVKSTGREYGCEWAHVFTVRDGRLTDVHEYTDTAAAARAHAV